MNAFLWWMCQTTIVVALLVPPVWLLCRAFRARPAVQHFFWLILLVKFLMPPVVAMPWTMEDFLNSWQSAPETATEPSVAVDVFALADIVDETTAVTLPPEPIVSVAQVGVALTIAWGVGCAIALLIQLRRIAKHRSFIRVGETAPGHLDAEIGRVSREMGLQPLRAIVVRRIASPFVWCFGWLQLVWPESLATEKEVIRSRGIIAHELAHVRRRDHWVAWLELAAGLIWWWNPVYWFVRYRLRESAELACDALAIGALPDERCAYAEMFLELSSSFKSGTPVPVLGMSTGAPSSFERRLSMILCERVSGKMSRWGFLFAVLLALATAPSWSLGQSAPGGSPPQPLSDLEKRLLQELRQKEIAFKVAEAIEQQKRQDEQKVRLWTDAEPAAALERLNRSVAEQQQLAKELAKRLDRLNAAKENVDKQNGQEEVRRLQARLDAVKDQVKKAQAASDDSGVRFRIVLDEKDVKAKLEDANRGTVEAVRQKQAADAAAQKAAEKIAEQRQLILLHINQADALAEKTKAAAVLVQNPAEISPADAKKLLEELRAAEAKLKIAQQRVEAILKHKGDAKWTPKVIEKSQIEFDGKKKLIIWHDRTSGKPGGEIIELEGVLRLLGEAVAPAGEPKKVDVKGKVSINDFEVKPTTAAPNEQKSIVIRLENAKEGRELRNVLVETNPAGGKATRKPASESKPAAPATSSVEFNVGKQQSSVKFVVSERDPKTGLVAFRTQNFHGSSKTVNFEEGKDVVVFEGNVTISSTPASADSLPSVFRGNRVLYNLKTGEFNGEFRSIQKK